MKKILPAIITVAAIVIIAASCSKTINDPNYVRCTCTYTDSKGVKQTTYDDLYKPDYPTATEQQNECTLFGSYIVGTNISCSM